jgi:hypothetical protein
MILGVDGATDKPIIYIAEVLRPMNWPTPVSSCQRRLSQRLGTRSPASWWLPLSETYAVAASTTRSDSTGKRDFGNLVRAERKEGHEFDVAVLGVEALDRDVRRLVEHVSRPRQRGWLPRDLEQDPPAHNASDDRPVVDVSAWQVRTGPMLRS